MNSIQMVLRRMNETEGKANQRPLCEFGDTILFHYSEKSESKMTTDWNYGVWLGKCTISDENFVAIQGRAYRTNGQETTSQREVQVETSTGAETESLDYQRT